MDSSLVIAVSNMRDGSMSKGVNDVEQFKNRQSFLLTLGVAPEQTALVQLKYEGDDYKRYFTVSADQAGDGILTPASFAADALFTSNKNLALLLPVADCIGAVLYDPVKQVLGLAHLGRHNLIQTGGTEIVRYMCDEFVSQPSDITVWLSPAAGRENYPLYDFDNRSLHEVAMEQLFASGIPNENVEVDTRDTTKDSSLFSHSEFIKGNRESDGRQAVVAMMRSHSV